MLLVTRKANRKTLCTECDVLQGRLNVETDVIVEIVNKVSTNADERSQQLSRALEIRDQTLRKYIDHVKGHTHAAAA